MIEDMVEVVDVVKAGVTKVRRTTIGIVEARAESSKEVRHGDIAGGMTVVAGGIEDNGRAVLQEGFVSAPEVAVE